MLYKERVKNVILFCTPCSCVISGMVFKWTPTWKTSYLGFRRHRELTLSDVAQDKCFWRTVVYNLDRFRISCPTKLILGYCLQILNEPLNKIKIIIIHLIFFFWFEWFQGIGAYFMGDEGKILFVAFCISSFAFGWRAKRKGWNVQNFVMQIAKRGLNNI